MSIKEQAISYAMSDIGLTEYEAEQAYSDYFPRDNSWVCDDCGVELDVGTNCKSYDSEYCNECWKAWQQKFIDLGFTFDSNNNLLKDGLLIE